MDAEVEALYGLPLDEFTKARDALARARAKQQGKEAGAAVKALRKPSVAAWALNQLARRHPSEVDALLEAGGRLRRAQTSALEGGDPGELREATKAETAEVRALAAQAASILSEAGRGSAAQEDRLASTLRAAATDPEAGDLLRRGVLTTELSAAGFGFGIAEGGVDTPLAPLSLTSSRLPGTTERKQKEDAEVKAAAERAERAERERVREIEKKVRAARDRAVRLEREADAAEKRAQEARARALEAAARAEELAARVEQGAE